MKYHAPTNQIVVDIEDIRIASHLLLHAMKHIRMAEGLPMEPYKSEGALTNADHAQKNIIEAADKMGIDLGARWGNEVDLRGKP